MLLMPHTSHAKAVCLDSEGEAVVVNSDIPSSKAEAVARAKWAAIEQSVGVSVKAQTIVQNFTLVDDAVIKQIKGFIGSHKLLSESCDNNLCKVRINACIEPSNAPEALSSLSLNNSIAVFIPAYVPRNGIKDDHLEESNTLSETLIGKIAEQGFIVADLTPKGTADAELVDMAINSGTLTALRSSMYRSLSNILLIGKADYALSAQKGDEIGYGLRMPFQNVTVRMTYRLVAKDFSGNLIILAAGAEEAYGMANNVKDAVSVGLKSLAEKIAPSIIEKVSRQIRGVSRRISVNVSGVTDISTSFAVKEILQNISWVSAVEDKGLGDFVVSYPESSIYLANSIEQKSGFKVRKFTPYQMNIDYVPK